MNTSINKPAAGQKAVISKSAVLAIQNCFGRNLVANIPVYSMADDCDYTWQLSCLKERIEQPEKYAGAPLFEDVAEHIRNLCAWLAEYEEQHPEYKARRAAGYYDKYKPSKEALLKWFGSVKNYG